MSLHKQLEQRAADGKPIRIALIGAGKFGSMYLAQIPRTPGMHLVAMADLCPHARRASLACAGWDARQLSAGSAQNELGSGGKWIADDWQTWLKLPRIEINVECAGNPIAAVEHWLAAF